MRHAAQLAMLASLLVTGLLAAANTAAKLLAPVQPDIVLRFAPSHSPSLLAQAAARAALDASSPNSQSLALSRDALTLSPLAHEPLLYAGLDAYREGRLEDAEVALEAALERNPRSRPALIALVEIASQAEDFERAVALLEDLLSLDPAQSQTYVAALARLARDPRSRPYLLEAFSRAPPWRDLFAARIGAEVDDAAFLLALSRGSARAQSALLERLVRAGEYDRAYLAWHSFLDVAAPADAFTAPYDQQFDGLPAPAPFNWRHLDSRTELQAGGGLYTSYLGRGEPSLLEQITALGPGEYRLAAAMEGEARASGGGFRWTLACLPSGTEIATLDVRELSATEQAFSVAFTVPPEACSYQRLRLRGLPGEFPIPAHSIVRRISIDAVDETDALSPRYDAPSVDGSSLDGGPAER
jgi:tetratricopeptide (TPR) repeat protein